MNVYKKLDPCWWRQLCNMKLKAPRTQKKVLHSLLRECDNKGFTIIEKPDEYFVSNNFTGIEDKHEIWGYAAKFSFEHEFNDQIQKDTHYKDWGKAIIRRMRRKLANRERGKKRAAWIKKKQEQMKKFAIPGKQRKDIDTWTTWE